MYTTLYYIKVEREGFPTVYKIGITKKSVKERYRYELSNCKITVLNETTYEDGTLAWEEELRIVQAYREFKYKGDKIFDHTGTKELFTKDVLELDFKGV